MRLVLDEKEKPLGVQILELHADERISEWLAALNGKVKLGHAGLSHQEGLRALVFREEHLGQSKKGP